MTVLRPWGASGRRCASVRGRWGALWVSAAAELGGPAIADWQEHGSGGSIVACMQDGDISGVHREQVLPRQEQIGDAGAEPYGGGLVEVGVRVMLACVSYTRAIERTAEVPMHAQER